MLYKPPGLWSFVTQPQETDLTPAPANTPGDCKAHAPSSLSSPPANKYRCPPGVEGPHGEPPEQCSQNRGDAPPLVREGATFRLEEGAGVSGQSGPHANPTTAFPCVCRARHRGNTHSTGSTGTSGEPGGREPPAPTLPGSLHWVHPAPLLPVSSPPPPPNADKGRGMVWRKGTDSAQCPETRPGTDNG